MDEETRRAIEAIWKRGVDPLTEQIREMRKDVGERFDKLDTVNRWRYGQLLATIALITSIIVDIAHHHWS